MTLLVLLPASTRAEVVAPDLGWHREPLRCCTAGGAISSRCFACSTRLLLRLAAIALGLPDGPGNIVGVGAHVARSPALWLRAIHLDLEVAAHQLQQIIDC